MPDFQRHGRHRRADSTRRPFQGVVGWGILVLGLVAVATVAVAALDRPEPSSTTPSPPSSTSAATAPASTNQSSPSTTVPGDPTGIPPTTLPSGPVTIVGESLTLSAAEALRERLDAPVIDAEVGRSFEGDLAALEDLVEAGEVGPQLVVHVGNNDPIPPDGFERIRSLAPDSRLVVMTVSHPRQWESQVNQLIEEFAAAHPEVEVIDWNAIAEAEPGLLAADDVHLSPDGIERYADLVAGAVAVP